jgi:hypothetical protein
VWQTRVRVCVCARVRAPEVCSGICRKGMAATRTRRRGRVAGWTCTARPWCRCGEGGRGSALRCGCARTRAEPGCPGPRRGRAVRGAPAFRARSTTAAAEGRRRLRGARRRVGLLQKQMARRPEGARIPTAVLRWVHRRPVAHAGSRGKKGTAAVILTGGAEGERAGAVAGRGRRVVAVQEEPQRRWRRSGRRLGEAPVRRRPPPRAAPGGVGGVVLGLLSSFSSSPLSSPRVRWRKGGMA